MPSELDKSYHSYFSINELRDEASSASDVKSFASGAGFTVVKGSLSGMLAQLLDVSPQQINADGLIYNPVIEVKSSGYAMNNQLLLELLKELYLLEIEKDATGKIVLRTVFPPGQK